MMEVYCRQPCMNREHQNHLQTILSFPPWILLLTSALECTASNLCLAAISILFLH